MASQLQCVGRFVDFQRCVVSKRKVPIEMGPPKWVFILAMFELGNFYEQNV
jgi:hypothetical protein